jgi:broad specificity polyphosphatase/5'/3'-nucleotidase SurE
LSESPTINSPEKFTSGDAAGDHANSCVPFAGRPIFWFTITPLEGAEEGTDRWAVEHNWVSITPLRLDLTDEKDLSRALSLAQTPPVSAAKKR